MLTSNHRFWRSLTKGVPLDGSASMIPRGRSCAFTIEHRTDVDPNVALKPPRCHAHHTESPASRVYLLPAMSPRAVSETGT